MRTKGPTVGQTIVALAFALSCFGLALFLWVTFGGPVPLQAQGYRFSVDFNEATQLAQQSDVRISGVSVGKVVDINLTKGGLARATIDLDDKYAPIPSNTRAVLRQKTLLGETYIELTPGNKNSPPLPEDGQLSTAQVAQTVQLDEIFRTFNKPTREAFRVWMQQAAIALRGQGTNLNNALGELPLFTQSANRVFRILSSQEQAVRQLVRGGGETFRALSARSGQLRSLIQHSATVFDTTARRNADLADIFRILPTFQDESRKTLNRLESFAVNTDPLVTQLRPAAKQLTPTLEATKRLAPHLEVFFKGLRQAIPAGVKGLPALRTLLGTDLPPLLKEINPFLRQLDPLLTVVNQYRHEVTAFFGNGAAALNGFNIASGTRHDHLARTTNVLGPETLAAYPRRLSTSRTNPYTAPQGYQRLATKKGLYSFETAQCSGGGNATLNPGTPTNPTFQARVGGDPVEAGDLFNRIKRFMFKRQPDAASIPQAPCKEQPKFRSVGVSPEFTQYLHVRKEK